MNRSPVLFVDDEDNVLQGIRRNLYRQFKLDTALGGPQALEKVQAQAQNGTPYAVVVSDMRMPGMNGVELLEKLKQQSPDIVRIMLTGNADQDTAIQAVNRGDVFRFLTKPCKRESLAQVVEAALRQHQLVVCERELLERTLSGAMQALTDILAITRPEAFGRTSRLSKHMKRLADCFADAGLPRWEVETLARLSQVGCVRLSSDLLDKLLAGEQMNDDEHRDYQAHPLLGAELIRHIPRLERIAEAILYQHKWFDGNGFPQVPLAGEQIPLLARMLHVVIAYDELRNTGMATVEALQRLSEQPGRLDPQVLEAFGRIVAGEDGQPTQELWPDQLVDGMTVTSEVYTSDGHLLVCDGMLVTPSIREHLLRYHSDGSLIARITVTTARPDQVPEITDGWEEWSA